MNITTKQWYLIIIGIVNGLMTGAALLTVLFGQTTTAAIIAGLGLINIVITSVGTALSTQSGQVQDVLNMKGVENLGVNADASKALASMAINPIINKIAPVAGAEQAVLKAAGD